MKLPNPLEQMFLDDGIKKGMKQGLEQGLEKGIEKGIQKGRTLGRKEGLEQGLAQGRREGAVVLLERLLEQRFGSLPQTVHKRLAKASLEQLEAWSDALVTAQSLRQVFR
jgi:flagellar biosynthesis/type III secretory pathway protein FliH